MSSIKSKINIERLSRSKWIYVLASVVFILIGLMLIFDPSGTGNLLSFIFGGALLAYGAFRIISYFNKNKGEKNVTADIIIGVLFAIGGLTIIIMHDSILTFIAFVIGIFLIVDGLLKLQTAINAKRAAIPSWWLVMVISIICIVLGACLVFVRSIQGNALWLALGVALLFEGIQNLISAIYSHIIVKKAPKDTININDHAPIETKMLND